MEIGNLTVDIDEKSGELFMVNSTYDSFEVNREQAEQLAEVLKRYSETGSIDE